MLILIRGFEPGTGLTSQCMLLVGIVFVLSYEVIVLQINSNIKNIICLHGMKIF